jgi:hypothetical protein
MSKRKKKKGQPNCGLGPHHQVSPMGHATRTKTRRERQIQQQRKQKQRGYFD